MRTENGMTIGAPWPDHDYTDAELAAMDAAREEELDQDSAEAHQFGPIWDPTCGPWTLYDLELGTATAYPTRAAAEGARA